MYKTILIIALAASVALGATVATTGNCNISDLTFEATDVLSIGHICTVDENFQCDSIIITSGGHLTFNNGLKVTMTGGILLYGAAQFTMNQSDTLYFAGDSYWIRWGKAGNSFTINGTATNKSVIDAEATYNWRLQRYSSAGGCAIHINHAKLLNSGSATLAGIEIQNNYTVEGSKPFVMKNTLVMNYGNFRPTGTYDEDDSIFIDSCTFINPLSTLRGLEWSVSRDPSPGTVRMMSNCAIYNPSGDKDFRIRGTTSAGYDQVTFKNCVSQNIRWDPGTECNIVNVVSFCANTTISTCFTSNVIEGDTVNYIGCVAAGYNQFNHHLIGAAASTGRNRYWGCISEASTDQANPEADHFLSGSGSSVNDIIKHIGINGGLVNCLTAASFTYNIYNSATVEQIPSKAPIIIFETNNPTGGALIAKNCMLYTKTNDYWAQSGISSENLLNYMDYNAWIGRALSSAGYSGTSVNGLEFGRLGWDSLTVSISSVNAFKNDSVNIGTFYNKIRGVEDGTQRNVYAEMFKMGGYDTSGNTATYSDTFTVYNLLGYLRSALIPVNDSLVVVNGDYRLRGAVARPIVHIDTVRSNDTLFSIDSIPDDHWYSDTTGNYRDSVNVAMYKKSSGSYILSSSVGLKRAGSRCTTFVKMSSADTFFVMAYGSEQLGGTFFSDTLPVIISEYSSGKTKAAITVQPENSTVNEGANATFSITATGSNLQYVCYRNGDSIGNTNSKTFAATYPMNGSLIRFKVWADTADTVWSNTVTLTVLPTAPVVTVDPISDTTTGPVRMFAEWTGTAVNIAWYRLHGIDTLLLSRDSVLQFNAAPAMDGDSVIGVVWNISDTVATGNAYIEVVYAVYDSVATSDSLTAYFHGNFLSGSGWTGTIGGVALTTGSGSATAQSFISATPLQVKKKQYKITITNGAYTLIKTFGKGSSVVTTGSGRTSASTGVSPF